MELPINFNSAMVKEVLNGRKLQTRRPIKPQPIGYGNDWCFFLEPKDLYVDPITSKLYKAYESTGRNKRASGELTKKEIKCPYGEPGDTLWVRETYAT